MSKYKTAIEVAAESLKTSQSNLECVYMEKEGSHDHRIYVYDNPNTGIRKKIGVRTVLGFKKWETFDYTLIEDY